MIGILFCMPWVEVRCNLSDKMPIPPEGAIDLNKTLVSQSGLQLAYGGYTDQSQMKEKSDQAYQALSSARAKMKLEPVVNEMDDRLKPSMSWAMVISFLSLVAACSLNIVMPPGRKRGTATILLLCLSLATIAYQCQAGSGFNESIRQSNNDLRETKRKQQETLTVQGIPHSGPLAPGELPYLIETHYTIWFHATWVLLLINMVISAAEVWQGRHVHSPRE